MPVGDAQSPLRISVEQRADGSSVIAASGELDLANRDAFSDAIATVQKEGANALTIDLRGLSFMDSSGLRLLIDAWNEANVSERKLTIVARKEGLVRRVLEVSGCDRILPIVEDGHE